MYMYMCRYKFMYICMLYRYVSMWVFILYYRGGGKLTGSVAEWAHKRMSEKNFIL